jgi:hypothetical protein
MLPVPEPPQPSSLKLMLVRLLTASPVYEDMNPSYWTSVHVSK